MQMRKKCKKVGDDREYRYKCVVYITHNYTVLSLLTVNMYPSPCLHSSHWRLPLVISQLFLYVHSEKLRQEEQIQFPT